MDLQETANKYEAAMAGAKNEQEARNVQTRIQEESLATVARRGWTPERYLTVAEAINANPALLEKARRLIEK